jgi:uncharacterized protein (DUF736 family)
VTAFVTGGPIRRLCNNEEATMIIGKFTYNSSIYSGSIATAGLGIPEVEFVPVSPKRGDGPDFLVFGKAGAGDFELGAAWAKTSKKDNPYLSVRIDGPTLAAPINCALTRQNDGSHALVWSRTKPGEASAEADQLAAA